MSITAKNPIRGVVAGCSDYYRSKADAVRSVGEVLNDSGYFLGDCSKYDWSGFSGSTIIPFYVGCGGDTEPVGYIYFAWHRMRSGKYEFTIYVSL